MEKTLERNQSQSNHSNRKSLPHWLTVRWQVNVFWLEFVGETSVRMTLFQTYPIHILIQNLPFSLLVKVNEHYSLSEVTIVYLQSNVIQKSSSIVWWMNFPESNSDSTHYSSVNSIEQLNSLPQSHPLHFHLRWREFQRDVRSRFQKRRSFECWRSNVLRFGEEGDPRDILMINSVCSDNKNGHLHHFESLHVHLEGDPLISKPPLDHFRELFLAPTSYNWSEGQWGNESRHDEDWNQFPWRDGSQPIWSEEKLTSTRSRVAWTCSLFLMNNSKSDH